MKLLVLSVFDVVSQVFSPPFLQRNPMEAERSFYDACAQGACGNHPEDLRLMRLAVFDDTSGTFASCDVPILVCSGVPKGYVASDVPARIGLDLVESDIPKGD